MLEPIPDFGGYRRIVGPVVRRICEADGHVVIRPTPVSRLEMIAPAVLMTASQLKRKSKSLQQMQRCSQSR